MAAKSKHYLDIYLWILKVIDSCVTVEQVMSSKKLVYLYIDKYPYSKAYSIRWNIQEKLRNSVDIKLNKILKDV